MPDSLNSHPASWKSSCYAREKYVAAVMSTSAVFPCVKQEIERFEK